METVIEVEHLRKLYGSLVAVDDVSFAVAEGEIFGLLGLNGAGKTTAVECIQGLRRPDAGRISVLGLDPTTAPRELRRLIGSQLQESALPDRIKVWEALDLFSSFGSSGSRDTERAQDEPDGPRDLDESVAPDSAAGTDGPGVAGGSGEPGDPGGQGGGHTHRWEPLLEQWGLGPKRKSSFGSLSGGQRQRLFVALALVNQPRVVFLDEMTTGLDPAARRVAWDLIRAIRDRGATVVLVTHFMDEAESLCDRLAVMKAGRIIALDSPQGLIATHAGQIRVRFGTGAGESLGPFTWLRHVPHVQEVVERGGQVEVRGTGPVVPLVAAALVERGFVPADLQVEQPALEDVFLKLAGETAGDQGGE